MPSPRLGVGATEFNQSARSSSHLPIGGIQFEIWYRKDVLTSYFRTR